MLFSYLVVAATLEIDVGLEVAVVDEATHASHLDALDLEECSEVENMRKVQSVSEAVTVAMSESEHLTYNKNKTHNEYTIQ